MNHANESQSIFELVGLVSHSSSGKMGKFLQKFIWSKLLQANQTEIFLKTKTLRVMDFIKALNIFSHFHTELFCMLMIVFYICIKLVKVVSESGDQGQPFQRNFFGNFQEETLKKSVHQKNFMRSV